MSEASTGHFAKQLPPSGRLKGRRIVITGAGSGIGQRTAELFSQEGAAVALFDRDANGLKETAARTGGSVHVSDVTDEKSIEEAVEKAAASMGGIDGLVNAAGIFSGGPIAEVDIATYRRIVEVNLTGPYILIRACLKYLQAAPAATIVNIASGQALLPNAPNGSAYAASKGGVRTLTQAVAAELAPRIRVNAICPGAVHTPMTAGTARNARSYALDRWAEPLEIAQGILFLTSTESSFVTGIALAVDGGRTYH